MINMEYIKDPYGFIYITTNIINGKRYVGQKIFDDKSRWKSYLGSGYHLLNAIKKYGKDNFYRTIVDIAYSSDELNEKEEKWIIDLNAVHSEDYYNLVEGGNVSTRLSAHNSKPYICIDNGMIFNSYKKAADWAGYNVIKVKSTFNQVHSYDNYKNEEFIFGPLNELNKNKKLCRICGKKFNECGFYGICLKCSKQIQLLNKLAKCLDCDNQFEKHSNRQVRCKECQRKREKEREKYKRSLKKG